MDVVVEAEMADPVEAPVLGSFAGAIDSVETEISRCSEVVARWRRWRLPVTGCAPSQIGIREMSVGGGG
jgi:hypothetical protein